MMIMLMMIMMPALQPGLGNDDDAANDDHDGDDEMVINIDTNLPALTMAWFKKKEAAAPAAANSP